jgi:hypothetical protein
MIDNICDIIPSGVVSMIKDIVFRKENLTSIEKVRLSLVSKEKMMLYTGENYDRINNIYNVLKNEGRINNANDMMFINKQVDFIMENNINIYRGEENTDDYKDFCYNLMFNFAYKKLFIIYEISKYINCLENYNICIFTENFGIHHYETNSTILYYMLLREFNDPCEFPEIENLHDYISFLEKLSLKQILIFGFIS